MDSEQAPKSLLPAQSGYPTLNETNLNLIVLEPPTLRPDSDRSFSSGWRTFGTICQILALRAREGGSSAISKKYVAFFRGAVYDSRESQRGHCALRTRSMRH